MDPAGGPSQPLPHGAEGGEQGDRDFSDEERLRLGAQQAAMIQLQVVEDRELREKAHHQQRLLEEDSQRKLMEQAAYAASAMAEQEQQRKLAEQQRLQQLQLQAAAETQKEEELKHLQMMALAEKEKEKQIIQQQTVLAPSGPQPLMSGLVLGPPNVMSMGGPMSQSVPSQSTQQAAVSRPSLMGAPPSLMVSSASVTSALSSSPSSSLAASSAGGGGAQTQLLDAPRSLLGAPPTTQNDKPRPLMSIDTQPPQRKPADDEDDDDDDDDDREEGGEFKLPQALEKVLAFKNVRAQQVGVKPEDVDALEQEGGEEEEEGAPGDWGMDEYEEDDEEEEEVQAKQIPLKESKNKKRKKKKKKAKQRKAMQPLVSKPSTEADVSDEEKVDIVYISESLDLPITDPSFREFSKIFEKFKIVDQEKEKERLEEERKREEEREKAERPSMKVKNVLSDEELEEEDDDPQQDSDMPKLSKKKMKKLNRLSVAELKQLVTRPDVVEMHDVTARDPKLLVNLKATRNSVPVPRHWCFKRKYLQGKRGIEKTPFQLPSFIRDTGIEDMRAALQEKEDQKNLKARMRERVRPKMGKIDIDYQKLHDAFFRYQTKPKMTIHGDLYYEGKEFETRLKEKKPGNLSDELRTALGMPLGPNADKYPPPWLIAMQRYGPPPSYPNLKIPGLNAPIPEACAFGYHAGGWGKPPVDETGKPLYGDVFGVQTQEEVTVIEDEDIDKTHWGQLESDSDEEEEDEEEEEEEEEEPDATGLVTPGDPGLVTPSGVTSVPVGMETPDLIELRKKRIEDSMDQGGDTPALYTVLPEKKANVGAGTMMGSSHVYDVSGALAAGGTGGAAPGGKKVGAGVAEDGAGIELALNPDELDLDSAAIKAKYDQQMREKESHLAKEDLTDMVAEHNAKQRKRKKQQDAQQGKAAKKYKDFKF